MRWLMLLAAWSLSFLSLAHAQGPPDDLTGTYALKTQRGLMVVRIEVAGGRLAGTLDVPGSRTIALRGDALGRYARGTMSSGVDTGEFEALAEGDTLVLKLSQRAEVVPLRLQRIDPSTAAAPPGKAPAPSPTPAPPGPTGAGDPRLVGTWVEPDHDQERGCRHDVRAVPGLQRRRHVRVRQGPRGGGRIELVLRGWRGRDGARSLAHGERHLLHLDPGRPVEADRKVRHDR